MKNISSKITKLVQCNVQHLMSIEEESKKILNKFNEYKKALYQSSIVSKTDKNGVIIYVNDALMI